MLTPCSPALVLSIADPSLSGITNIMCYLDLNDNLRLGQVCVYFNHITKSPLFIKFFMTLNEKTKIDISANPNQIQQQLFN